MQVKIQQLDKKLKHIKLKNKGEGYNRENVVKKKIHRIIEIGIFNVFCLQISHNAND